MGDRVIQRSGVACVAASVFALLLGARPSHAAGYDAIGRTVSDQHGLLGVAAVASDDVWAVGATYSPTAGHQTLIERWDGKNWYVAKSPNAGPDDWLQSVTAVSRSDVWAVGVVRSPDGEEWPLFERFDGKSWSIVSGPNLFGRHTGLVAVSSDTVGGAWAVGGEVKGGPLVEHWNRKQWLTVKQPSENAPTDLKGVAADSPHDIWAVGTIDQYGGVPLIEHSDGTGWSVATSPTIYFAGLDGVAAISPFDAWAFGEIQQGGYPTTLTEHWDGSQWTVVTSPSPNQYANLFAGTMIASSDVWAVGWSVTSGAFQTLAEHWDGSQWIVVPTPNPESNSTFDAVSGVATNDVWAVGSRGYHVETLTEHWDGNQWVVVPSPY